MKARMSCLSAHERHLHLRYHCCAGFAEKAPACGQSASGAAAGHERAVCMLQAGYAGSVITGGVAILDALLHKSPAAGYSPKGYYPEHDKYDSSYPYESPKPYHDTMFQGQSGQTRRLQQGGFPEELVPGRGGLQNTGNKIVQVCHTPRQQQTGSTQPLSRGSAEMPLAWQQMKT